MVIRCISTHFVVVLFSYEEDKIHHIYNLKIHKFSIWLKFTLTKHKILPRCAVLDLQSWPPNSHTDCTCTPLPRVWILCGFSNCSSRLRHNHTGRTSNECPNAWFWCAVSGWRPNWPKIHTGHKGTSGLHAYSQCAF